MSTSTESLIKYGVGSLLIIAGAALVYVGKTTEGMMVITLGLSVLGYQLGYSRGLRKGLMTPR